jgi:hypothetical protein
MRNPCWTRFLFPIVIFLLTIVRSSANPRRPLFSENGEVGKGEKFYDAVDMHSVGKGATPDFVPSQPTEKEASEEFFDSLSAETSPQWMDTNGIGDQGVAERRPATVAAGE